MEALLNSGSPVTFLLIAINVVVSLVGFWGLQQERHRDKFVFVPYQAARGGNWLGTLLSHVSHGDFGHLFLNMIALWFFGTVLEARLGELQYVAVYGFSGLAGTWGVFMLRRKNPRHSTLGASGSIAGVVFGSVVTHPTSTIYLLLIPVPIPAPVFAVLYLVASSFMVGRRDGVAHEAHIGGALAGFGLTAVLFEPHLDPLIAVVTRLLG